jgi:hypothetical protein
MYKSTKSYGRSFHLVSAHCYDIVDCCCHLDGLLYRGHSPRLTTPTSIAFLGIAEGKYFREEWFTFFDIIRHFIFIIIILIYLFFALAKWLRALFLV